MRAMVETQSLERLEQPLEELAPSIEEAMVIKAQLDRISQRIEWTR
jgi:hypothetical protein